MDHFISRNPNTTTTSWFRKRPPCNATEGTIVPYMVMVVPRLEQYLTMQHTDDMQVLLTQAMATLGTLARAVGEQHFSKVFVKKCINIGM